MLLPRLNDGGGIAGGDTNGMMDVLVKAVANAQKEFLVDLNALSARLNEQAANPTSARPRIRSASTPSLR